MSKIYLFSLIILEIFTFLLAKNSDFELFQKFIKTYNKQYSSIETFQQRFQVFKLNLNRFQVSRQFYTEKEDENDDEIYLNKFFDLSPEEFESAYLKFNPGNIQEHLNQNGNIFKQIKEDAPEKLDWREKGIVSVAKEQGFCGSCWAFSAIGNIEGQLAIKTNSAAINLSEQQLVDCDKKDQGCDGGYMDTAYQYLAEVGGVMTEADYPYVGMRFKEQCHFNQEKIVAQVANYTWAGTDNEEVIKQFLFERGPLAIGLNGSPLQLYHKGVFDPWICSNKINHGVLLVGYGFDDKKKKPYWIVKNSWGETWGESGFFRIVRGKGKCGVNTYVITADLA